MPKHKGLWNQVWARCDRCGFDHPLSMLVPQNGRLLCTDHGCLDNTDIEQRQFIIASQLEQPDDQGERERAEINNSEDLTF